MAEYIIEIKAYNTETNKECIVKQVHDLQEYDWLDDDPEYPDDDSYYVRYPLSAILQKLSVQLAKQVAEQLRIT